MKFETENGIKGELRDGQIIFEDSVGVHIKPPLFF